MATIRNNLEAGQASIFLRRILNVRKDEISTVRALTIHHFFQGFGIALTIIVAQASFLAHYNIKSLPLVYIISGAVLVLFGRGYAWLEHHLELKKLFSLDVLIVCLLALAGWGGMHFLDSGVIAIALMVGYRAIYALVNLEFWGLSALIFDVRQSKRLFGLISAGDVPAKLFGYLSVSLLTPVLGIENILLLAAVSFFISFFFMQQAIKSGMHHDEHSDEHDEAAHHHHKTKEDFVKRFFGSEYVFILAALSFVSVCTLTMIDFSFLGGVKKKFASDVELATFLGFFFAIGKAITIIIKLFLSGRIIDKIGVRRSLLVLPAMLLIVSLVFFSDQVYNFSDKAIFWLTGVMMLVGEIFQYSLNGPVFLALFQPLGTHDRLKGHTVVKGFSDPVALIAAGGLLLLGLNLFKSQESFLSSVSWVTGILVIIWLLLVFLVNGKYLGVLKSAVKRRFLSGSQLQIVDADSISILREKLSSDYPEEIIYTLELLKNAEVGDFHDILSGLLTHPSSIVKIQALNMLEGELDEKQKRKIRELLEGEMDFDVKKAALMAWCQLEDDDLEPVLPYLEKDDIDHRSAAVIALMSTGRIDAIVLGGQSLLEMIDSSSAEMRIAAAKVLGELKISKFYKPVLRFLSDPDEGVRYAAIQAAGHLANPVLLPELMKLEKEHAYRGRVMHVLPRFGEKAVSIIDEMIRRNEHKLVQRIELLGVLATVNSPRACELLLGYTDHDTATVRKAAVAGLKSIDFDEGTLKEFEDNFLRDLGQVYSLANYITVARKESVNDKFYHALQFEMESILEELVSILGFCLNKESFNKVITGMRSGDREEKANALEILDNLLPNKISEYLIPTLQADTEKFLSDHPHFPGADRTNSIDEIIRIILEKGETMYSRWTIATAIFVLTENRFNKKWLDKYRNCGHNVIEEVISRIESDPEWNIFKENPKEFNMSVPSLLQVEKIVALKSTELFGDTPEEVLVDVAAILETEIYDEGTPVVTKGEFGDCMYIIYAGKVKIHDGEHIFGHMERRNFFGELALLDPGPRSASVTATEPCILLKLKQKAFYELINERMEVAYGVLKVLAKRIKNDNDKIRELTEKVKGQ